MPRQNLHLLLIALAVAWVCYHRATRNRYAATLTHAMDLVSNRFIEEVEPRALFEGAMNGMVRQLDAYSGYTGPGEFHQFQQQMDGELSGVGIVVEPDESAGRLTVLDAKFGKPAYLAGLRAGDSIIAIDGKPLSKDTLKDAVTSIRGRAGTKVLLRVQHVGGEQRDHSLERTTIPVESILGDLRGKQGEWIFRLHHHPRLGYIRVVNFGERTAEEFCAALATFRPPAKPIDGLILDLRYNPGGLLTAATAICDSLLNEALIVTTRGRHDVLMDEHRAHDGVDLPLEIPIVVLVDRLSASASEIVAACLQDHNRAVVAGQRTWGKGTVQNVILLEGATSALRLTVGSYRRPSGQEIHKWKQATDSDDWGVRPDPGLEVPLTNHQNDLILLARRKRDLLSLTDLASPSPSPPLSPSTPPPSASTDPPTPLPHEPDPEGQSATEAPSLESQAITAAKQNPAQIDPQLQAAINHLSAK